MVARPDWRRAGDLCPIIWSDGCPLPLFHRHCRHRSRAGASLAERAVVLGIRPPSRHSGCRHRRLPELRVFDTETGDQVAYARVITDGATFGWLCDVFVDPEARGNGVGVGLIEGVVADLEQLGLKRTLLSTADAHGLYAKFGFEPLAEPSKWMVRTADVRP
ncbi:GNAT family N-acetyltransferase [Humibacter sp. RRB41]|uniref:GNAT family N-acetyltransferase n=1 Tax=Humibacter sp. RRB41 TaxID=2919946 RepID=UPI0027E2619D|nr:GNAT family N-acetyltransferase [Humibacter sp. RRB41]